jgi:hypothetical protein
MVIGEAMGTKIVTPNGRVLPTSEVSCTSLSWLVRTGKAEKQLEAEGRKITLRRSTETPLPSGTTPTAVIYILEQSDYEKLCESKVVVDYIKSKSIEKPTCPKGMEGIEEVILNASFTNNPITFFTPWGPRYNNTRTTITESDPECATLFEMKEFFALLKSKGYAVVSKLMPADSYGLEVNSLPVAQVDNYFSSLKDVATSILSDVTLKIDFRRWSEMAQSCGQEYANLKSKISNNFDVWVSSTEYNAAVKSARFFNPRDAEQSAKRYCIERVVEASVISNGGAAEDLIKLSLVRKEKDLIDKVFKTLYVISNDVRAPWLRSDQQSR